MPIIKTSPLPKLKAEAQTLVAGIVSRQRRNLADVLHLGRVLTEARPHLLHGQWADWCSGIPISTEWARKCAKLYEGRERIQIATDCDIVELSVNAAYRRLRLLEAPAEPEPEPEPEPVQHNHVVQDHEAVPVEVEPEPEPVIEYIPPQPDIEKVKRTATASAKRATKRTETETLRRDLRLVTEQRDGISEDYDALRAHLGDGIPPDRQPQIDRLRRALASALDRADKAEKQAVHWKTMSDRLEVALSRSSEAAA